jgi:hypothetical protein
MDYTVPTWEDWAFRRVWCIGLGWCIADAVAGIAQAYEQIGWYKDVMVEDVMVEEVVNNIHGKKCAVPDREEEGEEATPTLAPGQTGKGIEINGTSNGKIVSSDVSIQMQVERDLNQLIALNEREELEEVYGVPVIVRSFQVPKSMPYHLL